MDSDEVGGERWMCGHACPGPARSIVASCSPPSRTLRAAQARGGLRPSLTTVARDAGDDQVGTEKRPLSAEQRNIAVWARLLSGPCAFAAIHSRQQGGPIGNDVCGWWTQDGLTVDRCSG